MSKIDSLKLVFIFLIALSTFLAGDCRSACPASAEQAATDDSLPGPPPGTYKVLSKDGTMKVPFEMWRGDVLMRCKLNGQKVRLMIDNGLLWDQILLFGSPAIDSLGLDYTDEVDIGGTSDSTAIKSKYAEGITLTYDDVEFYNQTAIVTPYSSGTSRMWHGTEGQISATFLKHFAVRFDFDEMVMTLTPPDEFVPTENDVEIPITHHWNNSWLMPAKLELEDGRIVEMGLMMDLGYGDYLQLGVNGPHGISLPEKVVASSLGTSLQGRTTGYFGRLKSIELGGFKIDDLLTAFVPEDCPVKHFHESLLGLALLRQFNFTYDYQNHRMFIEPNKDFNSPSEYGMTGLVTKNRGTHLEVVDILPGSAAEKADIRTGDHILKIEGRKAAGYDPWELRPIFRREGKKVSFVIERDGKELELKIRLERLI